MKVSSIIKIYIVFVALFASVVMADELSIPYVVEEACPFEGCSFGLWDVIEDTSIYKEPNINSVIVGKLVAGTKANIETGVSYVIPGKAKITGQPYETTEALNPKEVIYILNYIGEGYSRIYQSGTFYEVKVARTNERCTKNPNWRYCWVQVLKEPVVKWWVKVKDLGWVFMESKSLKPIDVFSINLSYNKSFKMDGEKDASPFNSFVM